MQMRLPGSPNGHLSRDGRAMVLPPLGAGRTRSILEGVLAAAGIRVAAIPSAIWKRTHSITRREYTNVDRAGAVAGWPSRTFLFARKANCDRAEAALIGIAVLTKGHGNDAATS